jgi:hypothetical protein
MIRKFMLQLGGLAIALSRAAVALGQYPSSSTSSTSLNQMALRNAQQIMQQSFSQRNGGMSSAGRIGLGIGDSYSGAKPFSNISQGPAVSPYLNLFRQDISGNNLLNYNTLVEPQLRQQQLNQQQQQQNQQTTRRIQAISAQSDYNVQGSKEEYPTGHQTVFQYNGHYYPAARPHQKKRAIPRG